MDNNIPLNRIRPRLPEFFKQNIPHGPALKLVQQSIEVFKLDTVCEQAKCPNRTHCYSRGTLTYQILGDTCTRTCGFCAEKFSKSGKPVDPHEPERLVQSAIKLKLQHVVITSPARDDLEDDGANQFAKVVNAFRQTLPHVTVELLTPDFRNRTECLEIVFKSRPDIFNHNIETVRRLSPRVRSKATYDRTLDVLKKASVAGLITKSGLMVGHGETLEELRQTFRDLRAVHVSMLTLGQYLPPSVRHLPLERVYRPSEFDALRQEALQCGFVDVAAGPLVRSSFHADDSANKTIGQMGLMIHHQSHSSTIRHDHKN